ncbi:MAG TPA: SdrD B-like domain-containing protein [Iamia sp.]|nr:SdrD B-like domain-containing protein [Iamia sp.]
METPLHHPHHTRPVAGPLRRTVAAVLAVTLVALAFLVLDPPPPAAAAGTPDIDLVVDAPEELLYGETATVEATASNDTGTWGYNLSFREVLPPGIAYVPGSATIAEPVVLPDRPTTGSTTLLWTNLADLAPANSVTLAYDVTHLTSTSPSVSCAGATLCVGETYTHSVGAYVNSDPRFVPDFDPLTGTPITGPASHTGWAEATDSTLLVPFEVEKDEPNAEGEILRGLHDHATTYTVTITNNGVNPTAGFVVEDWLPAGLELLGCGAVDNTTDAPTNPGSPLEYPGAAPLTATATPADCITPTFVDTELVDPDGDGPLDEGVHTHVQWTGLGTLAAGQELVIRYAAGIPIRENTLTWSNGEPPTTGQQAANLDNNSGPETTDEQELTNLVAATGTYQGAVFAGGPATTTVTDDLTRTAEDLSIHKSSSTGEIEQDQVVSWDLLIETSEYRRLADIVVTETLPNGLCPLAPGTDFDTTEPAGRDECNADVLPGTPAPSTPYSTTTPPVENADGTWTVTFDGSSTPELAAMGASGSFTITLPTHTRQHYQANGEDTTPVVGRDGWTNEVALEGAASRICGNGDVDCTEGEAPIDGDRPDGEVVPDESGADQEAEYSAISKQIGAPDADGECDADVDWATTDTLSFALGDRLCYRLTVTFSPHLHTRNATVGDFLPPNTTYVGGSATALPGNTVDIVAGDPTLDDRLLTWRLGTDAAGDPCDPESEDCYVNPGEAFDVAFAVTADDDPARGNAYDLVENLMKFSGANTGGTVVPLRDDVTFQVAAPILSIAKTEDAAAPVRQGDDVDYTVTVTNSGNEPALDVEVWDVLPPEVGCDDVSAISGGGACTTLTGSDRIAWEIPGPIAPGASASVTYTVTMPDGGTAAEPVAAGDTLHNEAGVRRYETETNLGDRVVYIPSDNIDPTEEDDANVGPIDDDAAVDIVDATVTKAVASLTNQPGNDAGAQATIGETVRYTVTLTVPAGSSVYDAVLTDVVNGRHTYVDGTATVTFPDGSTFVDDGVGDPPPTGFAWSDIQLTFPDAYDNPAGSGDDVFTLVFDATIDAEAANTRTSGGITNQATLTADDSLGDAVPTVTSNQTSVSVVEPVVSVAKTNGGGPIAGGDTVHYTVTITNSSASRVSTANDLVVTDVLPAGLTTTAPTGITGGGTFAAGPPQTITWTIPTLAPGASVTREYDVLVDDAVVAGTTYTNEVTVDSTSMPPGDPQGTERTYSTDDQSDVGVVDPPLTKTVTPTTRTIGEVATYTIDLTIPANVELYDVVVVDTLDDGLVFVDHGTCTDGGAGLCAAAAELGPDADTPTAGRTRVGWSFGDIATAPVPRPVTLTYTALVGAAYEDGDDVVAGDTLDNTAGLHWNVEDGETGTPTEVPDPSDRDEGTTPPAVATVTVVEPDLAIDKDVAGQAGDSDARGADVDEVLTYTVVATNATGATVSAAHDLTIVDTLPADLVLDEATISHGGTYDEVAGTITWTLAGPFAPGASTPALTYKGTIADSAGLGAGDTLVNTAEITSSYGVAAAERQADPDRPYREYEGPDDTVTVTPAFPQLQVVKTSTGDPVISAPFPWTLTVTNASSVADAFAVDVVDTLPAGWEYVAGSASLSIGGGPAAPLADPTGPDLTWTDVADLPAGTSLAITFSATPLMAARDNATNVNEVVVTGDDADGNEANDDGPYTDDDTDEVDLTGAALGDRVWEDLDGDGVQDAGEPGIEGVEVTLYAADGTTVIDTTTTGPDGGYRFDLLAAGDYVVGFATPTGMTPTPADQGGDDAADSDASAGRSPVTTLAAGEEDLTIDAGFYTLVSLGDRVWEDVDGDGTQDAGEPGVEGVTVTLYGPDGTTVIDTTTTGPDGEYLFEDLTPGTYVVGFAPTGDALLTVANAGGDDAADSDADPATGRTGPIALVSGEDDLTVDAGVYTAAALGDRVWFDLDGDGVQDAGEPGASGVTVELLSGTTVVDTTTTGTDGLYLFTDLAPGTYTVRFTAPAGTALTAAGQGGDPATDSDADPATGTTGPVTIASGQEDRTVDAGLVGTGSLGDRVWEDLDGDGIQDAGEPGIEGVTVTLTWTGPDGAVELGSTTTGPGGAYLFTALPPGDYVVTFATPAGMTPTPADQGDDDAEDSDASVTTGRTGTITLAPGAEDLTVDAGFVTLVSLGDRVWEDVDGDGVQDAGEPGVEGVTVTLYGPDGTTVVDTTTTDEDGAYLFTDLAPGTYVVGFTPPSGLLLSPAGAGTDGALDSDPDPATGRTGPIALTSGTDDLDVDAGLYSTAALGDRVWFDLDSDGIQDAGEPGTPGVTVELLLDGDVVDTTTTDADGEYRFENLAPGTYTVRFTAPSGTAPTTAGQGGDGALDSDAGPTGETDPVTLVSGQQDLTVDAGLVGTGSLGDRVWEDLDGDGTQDAGEPGIEGATVTLVWTGPDGDVTIGSVTTGPDGAYLFTALPPGSYRATVTDVPGGLIPTGDLDGVGTPSTAVATLAPGEDRTDVDFGYRQEADLALSKTVDDDTLDATDTATFRITVGNDGPNAAEGPIVVTDTLPAGLTPVSASGDGWSCTTAGLVVTCTAAGPLANGDTLPELVVTATVDPTAETTLVNTATVGAATYETDESDNTDTATVTARHLADLVIAKSHAASAFVVGEEGTYTIGVANQGPSPAVGSASAPITVTDTLPDGLTPVGVDATGWDCGTVGQTVTCTWVGTVAAGSSLPPIGITVAVGTAAEGGVTNTATVTPGETHDPVEENDTDEDPTDITPAADLSLVKTSGGSFVVGEEGTFTFTVHNDGPSAAAAPIVVTDTLPTGLTYVSSSSDDDWTCEADGQDVTCTLDEAFAADRTSAVTITVAVDATVDPDVVNTAAVTSPTLDPDPEDNTSGTDDPSTPTVDLVIDKHHTGDLLVGATGTYLIDVANDGPSASAGTVTVTDTLPSGLTPTAASGTDWSCTIAGQDVTCTSDDTVAAGGSFPVIAVEVDVLPGAYPSVVNTATVAPPPEVNEVVTENNTDDDPTTVRPRADLELAKTHTGTFQVGTPGTYELTVTNHGPTPTPGPLVIVDDLPVGLSFASAVGDGWSCSAVGQEVTCTRDGDDLPVDGTTTVAITVDVGTAAEGTVTNTATVSGPAVDDDPENDTDSDETQVDPVADLSVAKAHTGDFLVGAPAEWTLAVANAGPSTARGPITVTDTVPDHVEVTGATGDGWTCTIEGQDVTCTRADDLPVGAAPVITLAVVPRPGSEGDLTNTATVGGPTHDPVPENDTDSDTVAVGAAFDLAVEKALVEDALVAGGPATWRIVVTNDGPSAATDVVVVDTLPEGLAYAGASTPGWACSASGRTVTCERSAPLAAGDRATLELRTTVDAVVGTDLSNAVAVHAAGTELDDTDNAAATPAVAVTPAPVDPAGPSGPSAPTGPSGPLSRTGTDALRLAALGLTLLAGGTALLTARHRRRPA